jgi:acetate kinase
LEKIKSILSINSGSSSLKFKLLSDTQSLRTLVSGNVSGIGSDKAACDIIPTEGNPFSYKDIVIKSASEAAILILEWLKQQEQYNIIGIGHRIVHGGMKHNDAALINDKMISELKELKTLAPSLNQAVLSVIWIFRQGFPSIPQAACFDSSNSLSCEYIITQLEQLDILENQKIIIAHLGNGCSMTALKGSKSVDSSMGFSPVPDMNHLLQSEYNDNNSREAIHLFCHHAKKQIGALSASMGGLDILVFTGGIGEHHPRIRLRICNGLEFLGIRLNDVLNKQSFANISGSNSRVNVYVIRTNEEIVIARSIRSCIESQNDYSSDDHTGNKKTEADHSALLTIQLPDHTQDIPLKQAINNS